MFVSQSSLSQRGVLPSASTIIFPVYIPILQANLMVPLAGEMNSMIFSPGVSCFWTPIDGAVS